MKTMKPPLTTIEIATLKSARKILRRIAKQNGAMAKKADKFPAYSDKLDEEYDKIDAWADALYSLAKVDFYGEMPFIDIQN